MERYLAILDTLSWPGVIAGAVAILAVGSLWYSSFLFGKAWMRHTGIRSTDITKRDAVRGYTFGTIAAFVQSLLIALIVDHAGEKWQVFVVGIVVLWLFIMLEQFNRFLWERATIALVLIQSFRALVTLMAAAFTYHFVS